MGDDRAGGAEGGARGGLDAPLLSLPATILSKSRHGHANTFAIRGSEPYKDAGLRHHLCDRKPRGWCVAACAMALASLMLCATAAGVLVGRTPRHGPQPAPPADAPPGWNVSRSAWRARPEKPRRFPWTRAVTPLRLVVVQHTAQRTCYRFAECAAEIRDMQRFFITNMGWDVPYSYMVGNEGRVYEGRGWAGGEAAHTLHYNRCSLGIGFMGNYCRAGGNARATPLQLNRTLELLEGGVRDGLLHPDYVVVAARDLKVTLSPGDELYDALRQWPRFNVEPNRFRNRSCDDIYAELRALDRGSGTP